MVIFGIGCDGIPDDMNTISIPKLKLYLDTTIPNYLFAGHYPEKQHLTKKLMSLIRSGRYIGYISDIVIREITAASKPLAEKMLSEVKGLSSLRNVKESEELALTYMRDKIFSAKFADDARHVAIATINNLDAVISWNFGHLVNIERIKRINIVNEIMGYKHIEIAAPQEVIYEES